MLHDARMSPVINQFQDLCIKLCLFYGSLKIDIDCIIELQKRTHSNISLTRHRPMFDRNWRINLSVHLQAPRLRPIESNKLMVDENMVSFHYYFRFDHKTVAFCSSHEACREVGISSACHCQSKTFSLRSGSNTMRKLLNIPCSNKSKFTQTDHATKVKSKTVIPISVILGMTEVLFRHSSIWHTSYVYSFVVQIWSNCTTVL